MSEGFATYFTLLFIEHQYGHDIFVEGLKSSKERIESFHNKNPKYTIIHDNLKNMKDVTSSQTYQKGSWVLHMLRGVLGTDLFWEGIRNYYSKYKDLNASTNDFRRIMEEVSGLDLSRFFHQWLYSPGKLKLDGDWFYDKKKGEIILEINQIQSWEGLIEMPIEIGIEFKSNKKIKKVQLKEKTNLYRIKVDKKPLQVILDPNLWVLMNSNFKLPFRDEKYKGINLTE